MKSINPSASETHVYLVVGVYEDNYQSWSLTTDARHPLTAAGIAMQGLKRRRHALLVAVFRVDQIGPWRNESPWQTATHYTKVIRTLEDQGGEA